MSNKRWSVIFRGGSPADNNCSLILKNWVLLQVLRWFRPQSCKDDCTFTPLNVITLIHIVLVIDNITASILDAISPAAAQVTYSQRQIQRVLYLYKISSKTIIYHNDIASDRWSTIRWVRYCLNLDSDRCLCVFQYTWGVYWWLWHICCDYIYGFGHQAFTHSIIGRYLELVTYASNHTSLSVSDNSGVKSSRCGRHL